MDDDLLAAKDDGYGSDTELLSKEVWGPPALSRSLERRLTKFAKLKFVQLTTWKDFMLVSLYWYILHQGVNVQAQLSGSVVAGCAIHSITTIVLCLVAFLITLATVVWREGIGSKLPTAVELAVSVFDVSFGLMLAASAGAFKHHAGSGLTDQCSGLASPAAGFALYTADVNGALTLIRSALLTWHRPFALGDRRLTGYASTLLLVVVMVLLQVLLLDRVIIPLLNDAVVKSEAYGTTVDWLRDVLFNNTAA